MLGKSLNFPLLIGITLKLFAVSLRFKTSYFNEANKALQPTPIRFAPGVARTSYRQLITSSFKPPVQGG